MKVKIIQNFKTSKGKLHKGDSISVKPATADKWAKDGLAKVVK